jgi:hypothetical protein
MMQPTTEPTNGTHARPNQETGIWLHAASSKLSSLIPSGPTRVTADRLATASYRNHH